MTYSRRTWLIPPSLEFTHTSAFIFCHWGISGGTYQNFIKLADCDRILSITFSKYQVKGCINFLDSIINSLTKRKKKIIRINETDKVTISFKEGHSDQGFFGMLHISFERSLKPTNGLRIKNKSQDVYIHADSETATEEGFNYKINLMIEELKLCRDFLFTKVH